MVTGKPKTSARPKGGKGNATKSRPAVTTKGKPWTFPKNTLEDAIRVPKAIEEKNAGNPMRALELARAVEFRQSNDWRFLDLLRSANQYGLVEGSGANANIQLGKLGQDIVAPGSTNQRQQALLAAFRSVEDFKKVEDFYGGKRIPEDEFFLNTLTREFNVPRDRAERFAEVFLENIKYLRAFDASRSVAPEVTPADKIIPVKSSTETPFTARTISREPRVREFLDTCFVMMPFGEWFDRYYQDIYIPAIKEAGFEPVRADELFTTGSVVEQIWDQITKAKVLLADLTDKNANVFYELGLAHAAHKPVIFASAKVEDVPFDLRHLRVIIYQVREPEWAEKLRKNVTDYVKNAAKEPEKSIPHPFRIHGEK